LAHEQTPLSNDTIDSILRHWEVGRAKDLSAPLCIERMLNLKPLIQDKYLKSGIYQLKYSDCKKKICGTGRQVILPHVF